mmetsp:Transcript_30617/g.22693  ORF Transcript_30617/g.22693 Transcript_30617/m.22693 type:complete len:106 (-) Transcript_30617:105-422(-)
MTSGIAGLYKGWIATMIGITPYIAFKMSSFDMLKGYCLPDRSDPKFDIINLTLGAIAGVISVTLTYPTDVVRRCLQLSGTEGHIKYKGIIDCFLVLYRTHGFPGL